MSVVADHVPRVLAIDAGGTMTDTFLVDQAGAFVVGKAQTTPQDESEGFMRSAHDALAQWDSDVDTAFPLVASGIFSGTAMLNRLLSRQGLRVGARRAETVPNDGQCGIRLTTTGGRLSTPGLRRRGTSTRSTSSSHSLERSVELMGKWPGRSSRWRTPTIPSGNR